MVTKPLLPQKAPIKKKVFSSGLQIPVEVRVVLYTVFGNSEKTPPGLRPMSWWRGSESILPHQVVLTLRCRLCYSYMLCMRITIYIFIHFLVIFRKKMNFNPPLNLIF